MERSSLLASVILRHKRERLSKCSLRGLEERSDLQFFTYPVDKLDPEGEFLLLDLEAPELSPEDQEPLLLIDGTWKLAALMCNQLPKTWKLKARSLPAQLRTAYPRKQTACSDPDRGLASVEALYASFVLTGRDPEGLLDNYYWKQDFLEKNKEVFEKWKQ